MNNKDIGLHNLFVLVAAEAAFMMKLNERSFVSMSQERRARFMFITGRTDIEFISIA